MKKKIYNIYKNVFLHTTTIVPEGKLQEIVSNTILWSVLSILFLPIVGFFVAGFVIFNGSIKYSKLNKIVSEKEGWKFDGFTNIEDNIINIKDFPIK